jgi:hypothetical protein
MTSRLTARVTDGDQVDHIRTKHLLAITSNRLDRLDRLNRAHVLRYTGTGFRVTDCCADRLLRQRFFTVQQIYSVRYKADRGVGQPNASSPVSLCGSSELGVHTAAAAVTRDASDSLYARMRA